MPASAGAFACACACARILPRPRHSPEVRLAGEYRPRRVRRGPALHRTRTVIGWKARPETSRGPTGDPSRPVVSPTYAQGSYYGTNRVVAGAPGRLTGPATPLLSTTRTAQPSGRDCRRSRSHVVRTGHVFRKNRTRGRTAPGIAAAARGRHAARSRRLALPALHPSPGTNARREGGPRPVPDAGLIGTLEGRHASQRDLRVCVGFGPEAWSAAPAPRRPRGETRRWASTRTRPWSAR